MSRGCYETRKTLLTPHVEIDLIRNYEVVASGGVNASAFEDVLEDLLPPSSPDFGPLAPEGGNYCRIYGTVGRIVNTHKWAYLNIGEPAISRTLMGFLTEEILKDKLPNTHKNLISKIE